MTTQTAIIEPGGSEATSSEVTIEQGSVAKISIYSDDATAIPKAGARFRVWETTPGGNNLLYELGHFRRHVLVSGPAVVVVTRNEHAVDSGEEFGVFSEV